MKFVNDATAKDTAFIKCFPDDSGVYARVLTETELDTLRVKSRTFNGNEKRTPELMDRRFKILHLQRALSGWEGLEFEDGSPSHSTTRTLPNSAFSKTFNMFI